MTLSASLAVNRYAVAEDQIVFPYTFKILDAAHLRVHEDAAEVTTGFTVSGVSSDTGGNVTCTAAPRGSGDDALVVTLLRSLPLDQPDDLPSQGALNTDTLEQMFDRLVMVAQQLDETADRHIGVGVASSLTNLDVTPVANGHIAFNADGDGLLAVTSQAGEANVTIFMETLLDDADAATARSTLGVAHEDAVGGILETNGNFVDAVIFGPSMDPVKTWDAKTAAPTAKLMMVTIEDTGADTEVNICDLTATDLTAPPPLATVTITGAATPTSIAAAMGYIIIGTSGAAIKFVDPHDGA